MSGLFDQIGQPGAALIFTLITAAFAVVLGAIESTMEYKRSPKVRDFIARTKFYGGFLFASLALGGGLVVVSGQWWVGVVGLAGVTIIIVGFILGARRLYRRDENANTLDPA